MALFAVQTTASHEQTCAEMIADKGRNSVYAALSPEEMTSYIIVEASEYGALKRIVDNEIPHARGVLEGEVSMAEVEDFLEPRSDVEGITEDAVVRLTGGPFQGEKARVTDIDDSNERVTVELYEATVPIPVEVRGDQLKVLDKEEWD